MEIKKTTLMNGASFRKGTSFYPHGPKHAFSCTNRGKDSPTLPEYSDRCKYPSEIFHLGIARPPGGHADIDMAEQDPSKSVMEDPAGRGVDRGRGREGA
jgi:hypothetical protein